MRLHGMALGLTLAGQGKLAQRVLSGWKVGIGSLYKGLYNASHLVLVSALAHSASPTLPRGICASLQPLMAKHTSWAWHFLPACQAISQRV